MMTSIQSDTLIQWDSPQSDLARWQAALDSLFPPHGDLTWLHIEWEPGERWEPIERYVIYQMVPRHRIPDIFLPWLHGPNPRTFGRYDRVLQRFVQDDDAPAISQKQWLLFRQHGALARPYWIVQGARGGHKYQFGKTDKLVLRMAGKRTVAPVIGEMDFAPVDQRVIDKLIPLDRVRSYALALDFAYRSPEQVQREEAEAFQQMQERYSEWLETQIEDRLEQALVDERHGTLRFEN